MPKGIKKQLRKAKDMIIHALALMNDIPEVDQARSTIKKGVEELREAINIGLMRKEKID